MNAHIIVMLTKNDQTVKEALEVFESACDLPVALWGFKDVGLPRDQMKKLAARMKAAGKKVFLEVVSYTLEACMAGARTAVELGFDCLAGTICYPEVLAYIKEQSLEYFPFVGQVYGSPSILDGSLDEIIGQGLDLVNQGVKGFDLLAYRYVGDPAELIRRYAKEVDGRLIIAGSVDTPERMRFVEDNHIWAFTMGSALFNKKFVPEGSFRDNLAKVVEIMDNI
jgi:hypothetical protein